MGRVSHGGAALDADEALAESTPDSSGSHEPPFLVLAGCTDDVAGDVLLARVARLVELPEAAFSGVDRSIFQAYAAYFGRFHAPLPWQVLHDRLVKETDDVRASVAARYAALRAVSVDPAQWEWAYSRTREDWENGEASKVITAAARALLGGEVVEKPDGRVIRMEGFAGARAVIEEGFGRIEARSPQALPEWDSTVGLQELLADVGSTARRVSFPTGIPPIDDRTGGGPALGELWFVSAYAGSGKTTFAASVMAYQAMMAGLNVVYATGETLLEQVRRRIVTRHARAPQFQCPTGIPLSELVAGTLSPPQLEAYNAAAADLVQGSGAGRYGRLWLYQMDMRASMDSILRKLEAYERVAPVHVLVVDSIDMVRAERRSASNSGGTWTSSRYTSYREQLSEVIEEFASLSVSYAQGRGLCVVSPYQISRQAYDEAITNSMRYELSALSETSMAERRAMVVLSLLADPEQRSRLHAQLLKVRHGSTGDFQLDVDWATGFIGGSGTGSASVGGSARVSDLLDM